MAKQKSTTWEQLNSLAQNPPTPDLAQGAVRKLVAAELTLDYTKARINDEVLAALAELAAVSELEQKFSAMFAGDKLNFTEDRAVQHAQLRQPQPSETVSAELNRMLDFAQSVYDGSFKLPSGKAVEAIVHIGIGGSFLGPKLYHEALPAKIDCHFVANIDPAALVDALAGLDYSTTLLVCVSKSGTTIETLANTAHALELFAKEVENPQGHLVTVSTNPSMGKELGCSPEQSFQLWDWVGGRYSVWSPVSISVAAANGPQAFREFLAGGYAMDEHVLQTQGLDNLAVTLALLNMWHQLALHAQTHCVVAYQHRLRSLPAYLQQLVMESNGKSVTQELNRPAIPTAGIWWGGEGTNDQHSYYQLLLQGTTKLAGDFIFALTAKDGEDEQMHRNLLANVLGQSRALMLGRDLEVSRAELTAKGLPPEQVEQLAPHLVVPGGQPTNLIYFRQLTPTILGSLLALYEHMTAVLGWLAEINSFDQWGVELGKINYRQVLAAIENKDTTEMDIATQAVIAEYQRHN